MDLGSASVLSCAESDDEYSDDDDMSWKVRRSAVKCLEALIATRLDLLASFYSTVCPALLARFKEREENVRADVFAAFSTLLRQSRVGSSHPGLIEADAVRSGVRKEEPVVTMLKKQVLALDSDPGGVFDLLHWWRLPAGSWDHQSSAQAAEGQEHQIPTGLLLPAL